jgi:epoxyqueuosine reductase
VLDARRCISYLTIEHRGPIPDSLQSGIGDWLFGCDVCQEVCPWNRRVEASGEHEFAPSAFLSQTTLAGLARMTDREFREAFRDAPLSRPKRAGMIRNALVVGANVGDEQLLEAAAALVDDPDPVIAGAARDALGRAGGQD